MEGTPLPPAPISRVALELIGNRGGDVKPFARLRAGEKLTKALGDKLGCTARTFSSLDDRIVAVNKHTNKNT
jgi:hypothetical protein